MKVLGILGGTGPESTIDYYKLILEEHKRRNPTGGNPPLIINSVNFEEWRPYIDAQDWDGLSKIIAKEFWTLKNAGADFGLISANTPHIMFDRLVPMCPLPLLSIVEATAAEVARRGFKRVGILGTKFTMRGRFYPDVFDRFEISIAFPLGEDLQYVNQKYFDELFVGTFLDETRRGLCAVIDRMIDQQNIEAVILGGTELPLILRVAKDIRVPMLDTARIHCAAAVDEMLR